MGTRSRFLLLGRGDQARLGGHARVLGTAPDEQGGADQLDALDPSVLGLFVLVGVTQQHEHIQAR